MLGSGYSGDLGISHGFRVHRVNNLVSPLAPSPFIPGLAPILLIARSPLLEAYQAFLGDEGFQTIPAADLAEALAISRSRAVSLVLLDINRAKLDDAEMDTGRQLHTQLAERHIPLLLIYPGVLPSMPTELGADYRLNKPFSPLELSDAIRRLLLRGRPVKRYTLAPILHTDDDRENLKLIRLLLARGSYPILATTDSYEVLRLCHAFPISLVISDVMRPDMNGFELLRHLREEHPAHHIPFMYFSARWHNPANRAEREMLAQLAPDDYLVKPCGASEILDRVQRVLLAWPHSPAHPPEPANRPSP